MNIKEYSEQAATTAIYPGKGSIQGLAYCALGLAGEAGEVANQVKKILRADDLELEECGFGDSFGYCGEERKKEILAELGDVSWYWVQLIRELGGDPEAVLRANLDKLAARSVAGTLKGDGSDR